MIREVLVTTCAPDGTLHIAPMGIEEHAGEVLVQPFRPSRTLDNLLSVGEAVVNYCTDVRIFAGCLCGRREWPTASASRVRVPRLEAALASTELTLARVEEDPVRPRLWCTPLAEHHHAPFRGLNRAQAAVLEAAILVSRLDRLAPEKVERELAYLTIALEKTAGPAEREAWGWLQARVDAWRRAPRAVRA